jgi:energy-coupling factor transport system ATP-binding protein
MTGTLPSPALPARPAPAVAPTLALEGVSHVYAGSEVRALDGVDVRIGPGERVALIGQNGSGKTTLVRHLNGLLRPTSGRFLVDGADAARRTVAQLARSVGLVFQDPDRQVFAGSVRSEVEFGPRNLGLGGRELRAAVDEALATVGLAGEASTNPYDLGGSRRKLLALASVLAMRTPVLVLDEPTTGQDLRGVATVRSVIDAAHAAGRTVIAISHDMDFVAEAFERILVMRAGRVVLDGPPASVFAAASWEALRSTYLEPPLPAIVGQRLALGSTPTDAALIAALARRPSEMA